VRNLGEDDVVLYSFHALNDSVLREFTYQTRSPFHLYSELRQIWWTHSQASCHTRALLTRKLRHFCWRQRGLMLGRNIPASTERQMWAHDHNNFIMKQEQDREGRAVWWPSQLLVIYHTVIRHYIMSNDLLDTKKETITRMLKFEISLEYDEVVRKPVRHDRKEGRNMAARVPPAAAAAWRMPRLPPERGVAWDLPRPAQTCSSWNRKWLSRFLTESRLD